MLLTCSDITVAGSPCISRKTAECGFNLSVLQEEGFPILLGSALPTGVSLKDRS